MLRFVWMPSNQGFHGKQQLHLGFQDLSRKLQQACVHPKQRLPVLYRRLLNHLKLVFIRVWVFKGDLNGILF